MKVAENFTLKLDETMYAIAVDNVRLTIHNVLDEYRRINEECAKIGFDRLLSPLGKTSLMDCVRKANGECGNEEEQAYRYVARLAFGFASESFDLNFFNKEDVDKMAEIANLAVVREKMERSVDIRSRFAIMRGVAVTEVRPDDDDLY